MRRLWRISLLILCLFPACSFPPYREELSLGIAAAQRMADLGAKVVSVGPLQGNNIWRDWFERKDYFYVPDKGTTEAEFKSGFIVLVGTYDFQALYVEFIDPDFVVSGGDVRLLSNRDETGCSYRTQTLKVAANVTLGTTFLVQDDHLANHFMRFQYDGVSHVGAAVPIDYLTPRLVANLFPPLPAPMAIGSWIVPTDLATYDLQYFLVRFEGTNTFAEAEYRVADSGLSTPGIVPFRNSLSFNLPADLDNTFYYHHYEQPALIHRNSYLCYYSPLERKYKTYSWDDGGLLKPLVKLDCRVDALLTTGELLSFEDNRCTVYSSTGEKKYSFLTGGLRFVYEHFIDGEYHLFFTLPAWFNGWGNDSRDRLYFYVYALPTRLMKDLS